MPVPGAVEDLGALAEEEVSFEGHDGDRLDGYLAMPRGGHAARPGLIVIHEAMGLNDHIRDVTRRFAAQGYTAMAPDLYTREGPPGESFEEIIAKMQAIPDERIVGDLEGAAMLLEARPDVDGSIACIGFCSGGRQTLLFACQSDMLDAAVDCWGGYVHRASQDAETTPERPVPVIDMLDDLSCPLLLAIGAEDRNPSPEVGEEMRRRLEAAGKDFRLNVYEGAGHAFFADYRDNYREEPAHRLWADMNEFLREQLGG